jgi:membrane protein DedA with SNARE-associated domain
LGGISSIVTSFVANWGYIAVFAATALEGFGLFFVPGETTLIAAAIVAGATHQLNILLVLLCGWAGGMAGDNFSYWVGHRFGFGLIRRYGPWVHINERRIKFVQYVYLRYGAPIVFIGRFVMLFRAWESFLAGANDMRWWKFFRVNTAAVLVWVCVWGLGAYGLGEAGKTLLEGIGLAIFVVICIILIAGWICFRRHEEALEDVADRALPGPLQAHRPQDVRLKPGGKPVGEHP